MKRNLTIALSAISIILVAAVFFQNISTTKTNNSQRDMKPMDLIDHWLAMPLPQIEFMKAMAADEAEVGDSTCNAKGANKYETCREVLSGDGYQHGALKYFNSMLCVLNKGFPARAEAALCHFDKSMGIDPDKSALPVTVEKTMGTKSVSVTVVVPTEAFATAAGYDAKGTVTVDGKVFMVLYWGGTGSSSKGFMITGPNGLGRETINNASYIQWDRTSADQFVKVFATRFETAYLDSSLKDSAIYGSAAYNSTTKAATVNAVFLEAQRVTDPNQFGCYRMYATGTKGGSMKVAKTADAYNNMGEVITSTDLNATPAAGTGMDALMLPDAATTANGCQSAPTAECAPIADLSTIPVNFGRSCDTVFTADATATSPFGNPTTVVNFDADPATIFP